MVRLKVKRHSSSLSPPDSFNSTMVRLKDAWQPHGTNQFTGFNSTMVRLKVSEECGFNSY